MEKKETTLTVLGGVVAGGVDTALQYVPKVGGIYEVRDAANLLVGLFCFRSRKGSVKAYGLGHIVIGGSNLLWDLLARARIVYHRMPVTPVGK